MGAAYSIGDLTIFIYCGESKACCSNRGIAHAKVDVRTILESGRQEFAGDSV